MNTLISHAIVPSSPVPVDVCIVTYNHVTLIEETVRSVLNQTYPHIRIIISDDASEDGTQAILHRLKEENPTIQIHLNTQNKGITGNCNHILSFSDAPFVVVFGGDDVMDPERIAKQVATLQANPTAAGCMSDVQSFDIRTGLKQIHHFPDFASENFNKIFTTYNQVPSSTLMVNRTVFGNFRFDPRLAVVSDWLLVNQIACKGLIYLSEPLTIYRRHHTNVTQSGIDNHYLDDRLVAIDILFAENAPHYWGIRRARSNVFLSRAARFWLSGQRKNSLKWVLLAFFECPWNKTFLALVSRWILKKTNPR